MIQGLKDKLDRIYQWAIEVKDDDSDVILITMAQKLIQVLVTLQSSTG